MTAPELTLNGIRNALPKTGKAFRVSDFLTKEDQEQRRQRKLKQKSKKQLFDRSDAIVAEMIGRFGYQFYKDWNEGRIDEEWAYRMLNAERAREAADRLKIESVICHLVKDCIRRNKGEKRPTGPKMAAKIIKLETKIAMGEK